MGLDQFKPFLRRSAEYPIGYENATEFGGNIVSNKETPPSTVRVRAEWIVSRLAQSPAWDDPLLHLAADQSKFHDQVRDELAADLRSQGATVATEVKLEGYAPNPRTGLPSPARADIIAQAPGNPLYVIEVKTGDNPGYTIGQRVTYPQVMAGHAFSDDPKVTQFGLRVGRTLPPIEVIQYYQKDANSALYIRVLSIRDLLE